MASTALRTRESYGNYGAKKKAKKNLNSEIIVLNCEIIGVFFFQSCTFSNFDELTEEDIVHERKKCCSNRIATEILTRRVVK